MKVQDTVEEAATNAHIRDAMTSSAVMDINGVRGRWSRDGSEWCADDLSGSDTLALVRISDADDGDVFGVARQVGKVIGYAPRAGLVIGRILVENDTSAFKRRKITLPNGERQLRTVRPKFRRTLELLQNGSTPKFLAVHLDRVVRDPRDLEDLIDTVEASNPRIVCESVTGSFRLANDADITAARVLVAFANQSSRDTRRRVRDARYEQAEEGRFGGGSRPYGFEEDGRTVREAEAAAIRRGAALCLCGVSLRATVRDINALGYRNRDGKPFGTQMFRNILLRPRNAGLAVYRRSDIDRRYYTPDDVVGHFPEKIIEPEEYWSLQAKLTDPERRSHKGGSAVKWLGSGIYTCPCGGPLRGQPRTETYTDRKTKEKRTERRMVYRCEQTGKGHVMVRLPELDALVVGAILTWVKNSDPADIIGHPDEAGCDVGALRAEAHMHAERLEQIAQDWDDDLISRSQFLKQTKSRRSKLQQIEEQLARATETHPAAPLVAADDVAAAWDHVLTFGQRREVLRRLLTVKVLPIGQGKRTPIHERVLIERRPQNSEQAS